MFSGMSDEIMDRLQWAFDRLYGYFPRVLEPHAVDPLLVGHRGVFEHPELVENTLPAFDLAVSLGGGIEFDLHLTNDDVPVVLHDPNLSRLHGSAGVVRDLRLAELQELAPSVPTLDELLDRYGHQCPHYFIEPKVRSERDRYVLARALRASLQRSRLTSISTLISPDPKMLDTGRHEFPELAKVHIFFVDPRAAVEYAKKHKDTGLAGWYFTFPEGCRDFLKSRGLHQGVGQIDYLNTHHHFRNRGFRYHFTNRIDRLVRPTEPLTLPALTPPLVGTLT